MEERGDDMGEAVDLSDLDLGDLVRPGRKSKPLSPVVVRPLAAADLALLATARATKPVALKKLSERHHGLARLIACGAKPSEAAFAMGYEPARVSVLQDDPAFEELVAFYRTKVDEQFIDTAETLAGLSKDTLLELRDRLEDDPEQFGVKDLLEMGKMTLDRSGFGPSRTENKNVTHDLGSRLEAARQRALEAAKEAAMRDITPPLVAE